MSKYDVKNEQKRLSTWEFRVELMDIFEMPANYKADKETGKYARFTGYVKEWATRVLTGHEKKDAFWRLDYDKDDIRKDWWDVAKKVANGEKVHNTIPEIKDVHKVDKEVVYSKFMPAYRAVKERFENRSIFQWIFNHSQYTAERDTIKALSGLMMSLTGGTQADIDAALAEHQKEIKDSGITPEVRKASAKEYREEREIEIKIKNYREKEAAKAKKDLGEIDADKSLEFDFGYDDEEEKQPISVEEANFGDLNESFEIKKEDEDMSISIDLDSSIKF